MELDQKQREALKPGSATGLTAGRKAALSGAWLAVSLLGLLTACEDARSQSDRHGAEALARPGNISMTAHQASTPPKKAAQTIAGLRDALRAGKAEAVTRATALVTGVRAPEVVLALALDAQERDGRALHGWALALLRAGNTQPLADVLARLVLGGELQQSAAQRFNAVAAASAPLASRAPSPPYSPYTPAATLGYWTGVLQAALASAAPDEGARGALISRLLADAARLADATPAGRQWYALNLQTNRQMPPDTRLASAMRPVAVKGIRANGEPDIETADESQPFSAFMGVARRIREGLRCHDG